MLLRILPVPSAHNAPMYYVPVLISYYRLYQCSQCSYVYYQYLVLTMLPYTTYQSLFPTIDYTSAHNAPTYTTSAHNAPIYYIPVLISYYRLYTSAHGAPTTSAHNAPIYYIPVLISYYRLYQCSQCSYVYYQCSQCSHVLHTSPYFLL